MRSCRVYLCCPPNSRRHTHRVTKLTHICRFLGAPAMTGSRMLSGYSTRCGIIAVHCAPCPRVNPPRPAFQSQVVRRGRHQLLILLLAGGGSVHVQEATRVVGPGRTIGIHLFFLIDGMKAIGGGKSRQPFGFEKLA